MLKTMAFVITFIGLLNGVPKEFPDVDAYILAHENRGQLLTPKELYEVIHKELTAIRTKYPEVVDIHHQPVIELGKLIVKGIDLYKLNGALGPIQVLAVGGDRHLVTFAKDYLPDWDIEDNIIHGLAKPNATDVTVHAVQSIGTTTHIIRTDISDQYVFDKGTGDCYKNHVCPHIQKWTFRSNGSDWTLDKE